MHDSIDSKDCQERQKPAKDAKEMENIGWWDINVQKQKI